jgi:hypothetical protein
MAPKENAMNRRHFIAALPAAVVTAPSTAAEKKKTARTIATADVTIYVAPNGDDANSGLSGSPVQHIQKACDILYYQYDLAGFRGFVQLADGTYTESVMIFGPILGHDQVSIRGNMANPGNVVWIGRFSAQDHAIGDIAGLKMSNAGGVCLYARQCSVIDFQNIIFDTSVVHLSAEQNSTINVTGPYRIVGGAYYHASAVENSQIKFNGVTVSIPRAIAFTYFCQAAMNSNISSGGTSTFTGAAACTGTKGIAYGNGVIATAGATFPGNVPFQVQSGGQQI